MTLVSKEVIVSDLSVTIDRALAVQLVDEYISLENRFVLRDWEPAELDGGQFCEVVARIIYSADSGNVSLTKDLNSCLKYICNDNVPHAVTPRTDLIRLEKVLRCVYKFRSQRGAVHISPNYTPNGMDARLVAESVRWCFAELLRIFWNGSRDAVAKAIRELLQFTTPAIGMYGDRLLVQRTDLTAEEEILILLHHSGEAGMSRRDIGHHAELDPPLVTRTLQKLMHRSVRQLVFVVDKYYLTDLGSRRVREQLAEKLQLG